MFTYLIIRYDCHQNENCAKLYKNYSKSYCDSFPNRMSKHANASKVIHSVPAKNRVNAPS